MNLIEQLGGYENLRGLLNLYEYSISFKYYKEFDGDFESAGHVDVFIPDLKDALLEYRRQHNIFEVGDKVVFKAHPFWPEDYVIHTVEQEHIGKWYMSAWRHAEPEELEAGKRLEVNQ